jgi:hypothetical protein
MLAHGQTTTWGVRVGIRARPGSSAWLRRLRRWLRHPTRHPRATEPPVAYAYWDARRNGSGNLPRQEPWTTPPPSMDQRGSSCCTAHSGKRHDFAHRTNAQGSRGALQEAASSRDARPNRQHSRMAPVCGDARLRVALGEV